MPRSSLRQGRLRSPVSFPLAVEGSDPIPGAIRSLGTRRNWSSISRLWTDREFVIRADIALMLVGAATHNCQMPYRRPPLDVLEEPSWAY